MMKKALVCAFLLMVTFSMGAAEDFWHIKVSPQGVVAIPQDGNGAGYGAGARIQFGYPKGNLDVGFEIYKWWRSYDVLDQFMKEKSLDSLIREGGLSNGAIINDSMANYDDNGLSVAVTAKYKFLDLSDNMGIYGGSGIGLYMIQVKRDEVRQNNRTGYWQIQYADYYLETKAQIPIFIGLEGNIPIFAANKWSYYAESRFANILNWDRWDSPMEIGFGLGIRYNF
jgi:hypothetical protein